MLPKGFKVGGVRCGISKKLGKKDLALFISDAPCNAAGMFTQCVAKAATVSVDIEKLKKKSVNRTSKNKSFKLLDEQLALVKQQRDKTIISLNLKTYQEEEAKRKEENKRFDEISKLPTSLKIAATNADIAAMKGDTAKIARSEKWIKDMNKDIVLEEAVKVIGDMK